MKFVFRYRYLLHVAVYLLGFFAPWNYLVRIDPPGPTAHVWGLLSVDLGRAGLLSIPAAFNLVLCMGIFFALAGAFLRTWGTAYLGSGVVKSAAMHTAEPPARAEAGPALLEDGPFRHMRNPLYVGTVLHTLALVLLMPASGAVFTLVAITAMQFVLIAGEERFLTAQLGQAYTAYCVLVPQLWPRLRAKIKGTGARPRWLQAVLGEIYMWGVAVSLAVFGWQSNAQVMERCVLVSYGLSLVVRAMLPPTGTTAAEGAEPASKGLA